MLTLVAALAIFAQEQSPMHEIEELQREIETLRMIQQLNFTRDQIERTLKLVDESRKQTDRIAADGKEDIASLKSALAEYRDALAKGETPSREQEQKIGELRRGLGEVMRGIGEAHEKLIADLKEVLNEKQWKTLASSGRPDPLRPFRENFSRMVEHLRENPDADVTEPLREQLKHMARPLGLDEKDIDSEAERIAKILKEAAEEKDLESKLADYVKRVTEEGKLAEAAKKFQPPPDDGRRTAQIFLDPRMAKALRKRLEHMK